MTKVQKLYAEVNCIGCDTSYNVLRSTFSSIWIKYNSVSLLLHSQFFLNVYHGRVAAWCQVCRRQICKNFKQKLTLLAVICPTTCCISLFANVAQGQLRFPATTFSVLSQCLSRSGRCLVLGMSMTKVQKLYAEVNCIGCDTSYNVLRSTFSSICLKDNSVSLLLHSHFFLIVYRCRVAAWCQVCRRQICKNFMQKLTALAVIHFTTCCVPRSRQSALRTTPFPFYYILSSLSMFIAVLSLPGARYVADKSAKMSCRS